MLERRLKLGLAGTAVEAFARNQVFGIDRPVWFVPTTINYGLVMEESGVTEGSDISNRWIVDPLDGTTNFLHGLPHFCVSIAMRRGEEMQVGVIYDPMMDELYEGERRGLPPRRPFCFFLNLTLLGDNIALLPVYLPALAAVPALVFSPR